MRWLEPDLPERYFGAPVSTLCQGKARDAGCSTATSKELKRSHGANGWNPEGARKRRCVKIPLWQVPNGGDLASTWVMKPEVHAELQITRKTDCKLLVANDDNYALAA